MDKSVTEIRFFVTNLAKKIDVTLHRRVCNTGHKLSTLFDSQPLPLSEEVWRDIPTNHTEERVTGVEETIDKTSKRDSSRFSCVFIEKVVMDT